MGTTLGWVLVIVLVCWLVVLAIKRYQRRHIPNCYVWLEPLERSEWKTLSQLQEGMRELVGTDGSLLINPDIEELEEKGLAESRDHEGDEGDPLNELLYEYHLTSNGYRKKLEQRHPERHHTPPRTV